MTPAAWDGFEHDPRSPEFAALRASDRDRDVALQVLAEAYAEGRIDRAEYDERADTAHAARRLGDLPRLLDDLLPVATGTLVPLGSHRQRAVEKYERERREALWTFLCVSAICWAIWAATMLGGFPWPLFPMLATGLNAGRIVFQREDIIRGQVRRLEKREARAVRERQKRALPRAEDDHRTEPPPDEPSG